MASYIPRPRARPDGPGAPRTPQQRQRLETLHADLLKIYEESKLAGAVVEVSPWKESRSAHDLFDGERRTRGDRPVGRTRSRSASPSRGDVRESRRAQRSGWLRIQRTRSRSAGERLGERAEQGSSKELARSNTFSFSGKGGQRRELTERDPAWDVLTKWVDCGFFRPETGAEVHCNLLAAALPRQREFTQAELAAFRLEEKVRHDSYIKARDGRFYRPEGVFNSKQRPRLPLGGVWDWLKHSLGFKMK
jgi:hypothetical protein